MLARHHTRRHGYSHALIGGGDHQQVVARGQPHRQAQIQYFKGQGVASYLRVSDRDSGLLEPRR